MPHERGLPEHDGSAAAEAPPWLEAKVENFFDSRVDPQCGHDVPSQFAERTSTSESFPHLAQ